MDTTGGNADRQLRYIENWLFDSKIICFKMEKIGMLKKNCLDYFAYCNMLFDGKCGKFFDIEEVMESSKGFSIVINLIDEYTVVMPRMRKDFVNTVFDCGIE